MNLHESDERIWIVVIWLNFIEKKDSIRFNQKMYKKYKKIH